MQFTYLTNNNAIFFILIPVCVTVVFILFAPTAGLLNINKSKESSHSFNNELILNLKSKCNCRLDEQILLYRNVKNDNYEVWLHQTNSSKKHEKSANIKTLLYKLTKKEYERYNLTCDLYNVLRRGKNQKIISYSLYGTVDKYYRFLSYLTELARYMYPGWFIRIYYDNSINHKKICEIECAYDKVSRTYIDNADFCNINALNVKMSENSAKTTNANYMHSMKWRWFPLGDDFVNIFLSRDTDSLILQREVDAVTEWLTKYNTVCHIMRDSSYHQHEILGGMWGFHIKKNRTLAKHLFNLIMDPNISAKYKSKNISHKGHDQFFLKDFVWPLVKLNSTQHDAYNCISYKQYNPIPFPSERIGNCFIGGTSWGCKGGNRSSSTCPIECRPKAHLNWTSC